MNDQNSKQQATSTSAMAITGLVLGCVALLTSFLPIINNISFIFGLLGLILAVVGLVGCMRGKKKGKGLAIAAILISIVSCVVVLGTQAMFSSAINEATSTTKAAMSTTKASSSTTEASEQSSISEIADANSSNSAAEGSEESVEYAYQVSIDGCEFGETYDGQSCAIVTYTFTNNSDEATSFLVAISDKAYQNGVELSSGTVSGLDSFVTAGKEIKPGATITLQQAYVLDDQSDITVECTEMFAWDNVILAEATFPVA